MIVWDGAYEDEFSSHLFYELKEADMKTLLLGLLLCCSVVAHAADAVWCMVTQSGQVVPMSSVAYLLSDGGTEPEAFSIVLKEGDPIEHVGKINFAQLDLSGIETVTPTGEMPTITSLIDNQLTISATASGQPVSVYSVSGAMVLRTVTAENETTLYIGNLAHGVYVLKVGDTAIKFMKK